MLATRLEHWESHVMQTSAALFLNQAIKVVVCVPYIVRIFSIRLKSKA